MSESDPREQPLKRLRQWRNRPELAEGMGFLKGFFKSQVEKPYKQLASLIEVWETLVPADFREHTRLEGLNRGVLKVAVDSSARLYELDRLLRAGLEQSLITAHRGPTFRKIQLRLASVDSPEPPRASDPGRGEGP